MKKVIVGCGIALAVVAGLIILFCCGGRDGKIHTLTAWGIECKGKEKVGDFWVYDCPTPNIHPGKNGVKAIVLHHTATANTRSSLRIMTGHKPEGKVSCHVLIDKDGSRYVLASPDKITWHAGRSMLRGRKDCNRFTVGIEFQGNTLEEPLTEAQIQSAIDYCLPIMKKYHLSLSDIVTHQQIRDEYLKAFPKSKTPTKPDITKEEYIRFKEELSRR